MNHNDEISWGSRMKPANPSSDMPAKKADAAIQR